MPTQASRGAARRVRLVAVIRDGLGLAAVLSVTAFAWQSVLWAAHPIVSGDLYTPFTMTALKAQFLGFWNPLIEFPNIETIDRLAFVAPFLALGDPALIQKAMIVVLVLGAGASMFLSARRLSAPWLLAVLAGIAFACNPWIAQRLQHIYLLPGYVVLPAVVALWWRPPRRGAVACLVLLLTVGSTTPHATAALWLVLLALLVARPTGAQLRRFAWTAGVYTAVNVWWWLPTFAYLNAADLVPSWPTWELVELFSRNANVVDVLRLEGYWWPLADVHPTFWPQIAGLGLAVAALAGLIARPWRARWAFAALAALFGVLALGTNGPALFGALTIEGPLADRLGWLLRDPNKLVGAMAAFLMLLAARAGGATGAEPPRSVIAFHAVLLGGYLAFAVPWVSTYVEAAYEANPVPEGLQDAAAWLEEQPGRAAWIPSYYGNQTFWNGENLTPEFLARGSPAPTLAPYAYDDRAVAAFRTLDLGAVVGDVVAEPGELMQRFGVRWLVHHRDVMPSRLQPPGAWDPRVALRAIRLTSHDLPIATEFPGVTVYEAPEHPEPTVVTPLLSQRPTAAAAALSAFAEPARQLVAVPSPHAGVVGTLLLPGDDLRLAWSTSEVRVPLPMAAPHAAPAERWSRFAETELTWWAHLDERGGPPPPDAPGVVVTSRSGASLMTTVTPGTGPHGVWIRTYRGPEAGRFRLEVGDARWAVDAKRPAAEMAWERLGVVDARGEDIPVRLENLHGRNVVADLLLVPAAAELAADEAAAATESAWVWTQNDSCRTHDRSAHWTDTVTIDGSLPWDQPLALERSWQEVQWIELDLYGYADDRIVEVWTIAGGRWIGLGEIEVWWPGWQTAFVPVDSTDFASAPSARNVDAELLRLLARSDANPAGSPRSAHADAPPVQVGRAVLHGAPPCVWTVSIPKDGTLHLVAAGAATSFPVEANGARFSFNAAAGASLQVSTGELELTFPEGVPAGVSALWLGSSRPQELGRSPVTSAVCPDAWRLLRTDTRWTERLGARVGPEPADTVAVDGLLAGVWLAPGSCGDVKLRNPWALVGSLAAAFSLFSLAGLAAVGVLRGGERG